MTATAPAEWFTGTVFIDPFGAAPDDAPFAATRVTFTPGARTAWHTHPHGQTIHVVSGVCLVGREGGAVERLTTGESAWFAPGENHWHGAAPDALMAHVAVHGKDADGNAATWGPHVSDAEYGA
ncbi:MAG: hypothetical protein QOF76_5566 [Solirubrobacteraceae bacterium]|jgi:quercetin dioxygenase-like cupin family protein|nr:hypothetical protein [Solirubrobacteraceae bacterium]